MVCDNMLQGLGRYLRCLGVDVRLLDNEDDHRKAAEVSAQLPSPRGCDAACWGAALVLRLQELPRGSLLPSLC